jgi:hypothetical protein
MATVNVPALTVDGDNDVSTGTGFCQPTTALIEATGFVIAAVTVKLTPGFATGAV